MKFYQQQKKKSHTELPLNPNPLLHLFSASHGYAKLLIEHCFHATKARCPPLVGIPKLRQFRDCAAKSHSNNRCYVHNIAIKCSCTRITWWMAHRGPHKSTNLPKWAAGTFLGQCSNSISSCHDWLASCLINATVDGSDVQVCKGLVVPLISF